MRTIPFLFFRTMWRLSVNLLALMYRLGFPSWALNSVPEVFGITWAFRGMRRLGWHPDDAESL